MKLVAGEHIKVRYFDRWMDDLRFLRLFRYCIILTYQDNERVVMDPGGGNIFQSSKEFPAQPAGQRLSY